MNKDYFIQLSIQDEMARNIGSIKLNETDSVVLNVTMTQNGLPVDLSGATYVTIAISKPDTSVNNGYCEIVDAINGKIKYTLPVGTVNQAGTYMGEIQIYNGTSMMSGALFSYYVKNTLFNDEGVSTQPDYPVLTQLIADVSGFVSVEADRVVSENERVANESARIDSENQRDLAESGRSSAEATRVTEFYAIKSEWGQVETMDVRAEVMAARNDGISNFQSLKYRLEGVKSRDIPFLVNIGLVEDVFYGELPDDISTFGPGSAICFKALNNFTGVILIRLLPYPEAYPLKTAGGTGVPSLKAGSYYTARFNTDTNPHSFQLLGEGASGDAVASNLLSGKTATTGAGPITGTMPDKSGLSTYGIFRGMQYDAGYGGNMISVEVTPGYHNAAGRVLIMEADLVAANILSGKMIFGVSGTIVNRPGDWVATSSDLPGGGMLKLRPPAGYYDGSTSKVTITDADFIAANIKSGVNLFGLVGALVEGKQWAEGTLGVSLTFTQTTNITTATIGFVPKAFLVVYQSSDASGQRGHIMRFTTEVTGGASGDAIIQDWANYLTFNNDIASWTSQGYVQLRNSMSGVTLSGLKWFAIGEDFYR